MVLRIPGENDGKCYKRQISDTLFHHLPFSKQTRILSVSTLKTPVYVYELCEPSSHSRDTDEASAVHRGLVHLHKQAHLATT